jgi:hypothetical protein
MVDFGERARREQGRPVGRRLIDKSLFRRDVVQGEDVVGDAHRLQHARVLVGKELAGAARDHPADQPRARGRVERIPKGDLRDRVRVAEAVEDPFPNALLDRAAGIEGRRRREDDVDNLADQLRPELTRVVGLAAYGLPEERSRDCVDRCRTDGLRGVGDGVDVIHPAEQVGGGRLVKAQGQPDDDQEFDDVHGNRALDLLRAVRFELQGHRERRLVVARVDDKAQKLAVDVLEIDS